MKLINILITLVSFNYVFAHNIDYKKTILRDWIIEGKSFKGSFSFNRNDSVFFENSNEKMIGFPINSFKGEENIFLRNRISEINILNKQLNENKLKHISKNKSTSIIIISILLISLLLCSLFIKQKQKIKFIFPIIIVGLGTFLVSFTDPNTIRNAFLPFAPNVNTFWDNNYLYVESKGIPATHNMMVGISNHGWQQQVPIPQCYIGNNAWSIPLNPVMSTNPIPVNQSHFTRGAIGIAINGVPIFNPFTNTGVDAFLDGQLDDFGGHCGRGDDYHYHTAPLHLHNQTSSTMPIAYAFDGFAVFGNVEPDGTPMNTLDANHGHNFNGVYHYHGTTNAPYMIAKFAGVVTEDATNQLIPQAQASPVRTENWTPLNGALITSCTTNGSNNGYNLSYSLNGISGYATNYSWNGSIYTFNYVNPSGTSTNNYNGFNQCNVPLSIKDVFEVKQMVIYPNPFDDKIYLKTSDLKEIYTLYNNMGQIIFSGKNINEQNFSTLISGVYYLKVNNENKAIKLIKK